MYTLAPYLKKKKSQIEKVAKSELKEFNKLKKAVSAPPPKCKCGPRPKPSKGKGKKKIIYK